MMVKENLKHPLFLIFSSFLFLFLFFRFGPKLPISVLSQQKGEPLVVSGEGKVSVVPDIAKVTLGIEENGASLKTVQDSVNKKSNNLVEILKKLGIGKGDIKTTSYNVHPEYNYDERTPKITGFRVSISYEVKITDFDKINDVLVKATEVGANTIGNISFEVNDETKNTKLNEARKQAVEAAKTKADGLARAAGISLGKIINISESKGTEPRPIYTLKEGIGSAPPIQPDIQPGETEISVMVSLSYEIR